MLKRTIVLSLVLSLFVAFGAQAADLVQPDKDSGNTLIPASDTHRNLYAVGGNVTVNGTTLGDLVAAGGMVNVVGSVEQDAIIAGGTLDLSGSVGGDIRVAGGNLSINGTIGGDAMIAGGNVNLGSRSSVGGDVVAATGNLTISAPVKGSIRVVGGNVTINSKVEGNVNIQTSQQLTFGPNAEVLGQIIHKGTKQAKVEQGAKVGNIQFTEVKAGHGKRGAAGLLTLALLIKLLATIAAGLLLLKFVGGFVNRTVTSTFASPWENLGIGLAGLIVVPIAAILLLFTFVGYYISLLGILMYILLIAVAIIIATIATGRQVYRWIGKQAGDGVDWKALVIGALIWSLLRFIPIAGWIVMSIVFLMAFGAVIKQVWSNRQKQA